MPGERPGLNGQVVVDAGKSMPSGQTLRTSPMSQMVEPVALNVDEVSPEVETPGKDEAPEDKMGHTSSENSNRHEAKAQMPNAEDFISLGALRDVELLSSCVLAFGHQLHNLSKRQIIQEDSIRGDILNLASKVEASQSLCRDTMNLGVQHAQAVMGLAMRMNVMEQQMEELVGNRVASDVEAQLRNDFVEDPNEQLYLSNFSEEKVGPAEIATRAVMMDTLSEGWLGSAQVALPTIEDAAAASTASTTDLSTDYAKHAGGLAKAASQQVLNQYAESAHKVSAQVSSIETRVEKLEERIGDEVRHALSALGFSNAGNTEPMAMVPLVTDIESTRTLSELLQSNLIHSTSKCSAPGVVRQSSGQNQYSPRVYSAGHGSQSPPAQRGTTSLPAVRRQVSRGRATELQTVDSSTEAAYLALNAILGAWKKTDVASYPTSLVAAPSRENVAPHLDTTTPPNPMAGGSKTRGVSPVAMSPPTGTMPPSTRASSSQKRGTSPVAPTTTTPRTSSVPPNVMAGSSQKRVPSPVARMESLPKRVVSPIVSPASSIVASSSRASRTDAQRDDRPKATERVRTPDGSSAASTPSATPLPTQRPITSRHNQRESQTSISRMRSYPVTLTDMSSRMQVPYNKTTDWQSMGSATSLQSCATSAASLAEWTRTRVSAQDGPSMMTGSVTAPSSITAPITAPAQQPVTGTMQGGVEKSVDLATLSSCKGYTKLPMNARTSGSANIRPDSASAAHHLLNGKSSSSPVLRERSPLMVSQRGPQTFGRKSSQTPAMHRGTTANI